jgi:bacteriocin biosynthesis cyclodehydratase domain-containing protein
VRPALKAGLLPVWRDRETVQIGIDPRRAVALTGMSQAALVISLLDGSRDRDQVIAVACEQGIAEPVTDRIMTLLAAAGALDDYPAAAMRALPQDQRRRLSAELAAAALARGHSDAGATALVRRDAASVQIYGPGRIAAGIADILATSGVGRVSVSATVRTADSASDSQVRPGPATQGRATQGRATQGPAAQRPATQRPAAQRPATQRPAAQKPAAPRPATQRPARPNRAEQGRGRRGGGQLSVPDLAILVGRQGPDVPAWLMRTGVAHLAVTAEEAIGVVGPLVRPGRTACLRCLDFTRAGLDPAWPLILAQLADRTAYPPACDAALAAAVAAQAAAQALAFVDREPLNRPAENGTLELVLPAWQWRRRTWLPNAACGCRDDPARRPLPS